MVCVVVDMLADDLTIQTDRSMLVSGFADYGSLIEGESASELRISP